MISIVLYGRNDSYGYNLHKRAALSLNCMAEVLTDPSDEILFVDYNTPDDFPTFPEAIQDTLTKRARGRLRILRVRPCIHERFKSKTHLVALEPVARNVAIRRSEPSNRWILSTNTDMIFVPRGGGSLSEIAGQLAPGFYHAPRIELPEVLWESFDRGAPADVIGTVRDWGTALHLNEIILGSNYILYDGPGDFQLLLRSDLLENQGFHEGMLLGWHVDSNMAKRMYIKYGTVGDLGNQVYGYHCDHTRQVTPAHSHSRLQNDWRIFCDEVERPDIPELADMWGCVNDTIEEVRLVANPASVYVQGLREAIGGRLAEASVVKYTHETYNKISYDPRHVLPFLADMFVSMPRRSNLGWYGAGVEMLSRFAAVWEKLGFTGKILADRDLVQQNDLPAIVNCVASAELLDAADAFVFDFGDLPGSPHDAQHAVRQQLSDDLLRRFHRVVRAERRRLADALPPRRVTALNAINNQFEGVVCGHIAAAATPCATHMRHGYVLPPKAKDDWLPLLDMGQAGIRVGERLVNSNPRKLGVITYGPFRYLDEGRYRLSIEIEPLGAELDKQQNEQCIVVEVRSGAELLGVYLIRRQALKRPTHEFFFDISATVANEMRGIETRIRLLARITVSIRSVTIEPVPAFSNSADDGAITVPPALQVADWLPYLFVGPLGRADDLGVLVRKGRPEHAVFGPYWPLPAGKYQLTAKIEVMSENASHGIRADVTADTGARTLVSANFSPGLLPRDENDGLSILRLPFSVRSRDAQQQRLIETRFWSSGEARFRIRSLSVTPRAERDRENLYPFLLAGEVGTRRYGKLQNVAKKTGIAVYSQAIELEPGRYRLALEIACTDDEPPSRTRPCAIAMVKQGFDVLAISAITFATSQIAKEELIFNILPASDTAQIEFLFQVLGAVNVGISSLNLDPLGPPAAQQIDPAVCRLENWLPFLQLSQGAYVDGDSVVVSEGHEGFPVYGPFWTLPAGHYEMIASLAAYPSCPAANPVITGEVTAAGGRPLFAAAKWRLGQYQLANAGASIEFRLPFTLAGDLSPELRAIETRLYSPGNGGFRIRSLAVKVKNDEVERNWFPYLFVGECGIHNGWEIKSIEDNGCIASTPPIAISPGRYNIIPDIGTVGAEHRDRGCIALEVWSGQDLVALAALTENDQPLEFDAAEEVARRGIELRIRAVAATVFSIRGLVVERTSDAIAPDPVPTVLKLQDWLPFLQIRPRAHADEHGIVVSQGQDDFPVYGPYWTLPAGRYDMIASIVPDLSNRDNNPVITGEVVSECGKRVFAAGKWHLGQFRCGDDHQAVELRVPFTLAADLSEESRRIETRIFSPGNASFRIRSLTVKMKTDEPKSDWFSYLTVAECGIHTGREIKSLGNKPGCIAYTPIMEIAPGHYRLILDVAAVCADTYEKARIGIEIGCGLESIVKETRDVRKKQPLEFDVTEAISRKGVELRICGTAPTVVSIRGLLIEKISDTVTQHRFLPAVNRTRIKRLVWNGGRVSRIRSVIARPLRPLKSLPNLWARAYASLVRTS